MNIRKVSFISALLLITYYLLLPSNVLAQAPRNFESGRGEVVDPGNAQGGVATIKGFEAIFYNIVAISLSIAGIVLFIMLLNGGFKYLTAGDNADKATAAHQTLTYAFLGFILIIASFLILRLIETFTGVRITIFKVTN